MDKVEDLGESVPSNDSTDADTTFEPTIDELMDELVDDEQTLREEEEIAALENDNPLDEIATLKEESDMPLEQLLAKYAMPATAAAVGPPRKKFKKSKKKQKVALQKMDANEEEQTASNADKPAIEENAIEEISQEHETVQSNDSNKNEIEESANEAVEERIEPNIAEKLKIRRSHLFELYPEQNFDSTIVAANRQETLDSEDEENDDIDEEEETEPDYVKKTIMVGSAFQAVIPSGLSQYGDILPYENEDKLVWEPSQVSETEVEDYLLKIRDMKPTSTDEEQATPTTEEKSIETAANTVDSAKQSLDTVSLKQQNLSENKNGDADSSSVIKDNEQALHLLVQCGYDFKEALRRKKLNSVPLTGGTMSIWSEEECQKFEEGIQKFGKDFLKIRQHQVRTRTMRELVQFYYLWKKSERRDHNFANADTVDHMDIYLNEGEDYGATPGTSPVLTAAATLLGGRKINGCSQNNFSIMTGKVGSANQITSPSKSGSRKRTASDAGSSTLLNPAGGNLTPTK